MLLSQPVECNEHTVDKVNNFHSVHLTTNCDKAIQVAEHDSDVLEILKEQYWLWLRVRLFGMIWVRINDPRSLRS